MKKSSTENRVKDLILIGDANQNVEYASITNFMTHNELANAHKCINEIVANALENVHKYGKNCIDIVMHACGLIDHIDGCKLTKCDEIIINDHRGYLVDVEIERCCDCKLNKYDSPNHPFLNNTRKIHIKNFKKKQMS